MIYKCKFCGTMVESDGYLHGTPCPNCHEKVKCWEKQDKHYSNKGGRPKGSKNKKGVLPRGFELRKYYRDVTNAKKTVDWWFKTGQITQAEYDVRIDTIKKYLTRTEK